MNRRQEIIAQIKKVPAIPAGAVKVTHLLRNPDISITELERTIEIDPGLSANLLRMANSAYFAGPRTIGSIRESILRLGTKRIHQLVMASAVAPVAGKAIKGYDLSPGGLWKHSVCTAIGTEELSAVLGITAPNYTFTAGLLHDLGKIVLGTFIEVDAAPIMEVSSREGVSFDEAERMVLGIDHAEVGALLLESWNLPDYMVQVVRWHQTPDQFEGDKLVVDLVHAADALSMMGGLGTGRDGLNYHLSSGVTKRLKLNIHAAESTVNRIHSSLEKVESMMNSATLGG